MITWRRTWLAVALASGILQGCGGGEPTDKPAVDTLAVAAQSLRGQVLSSDGVPVPKATVTWGAHQTIADADGQFEFAKPGSLNEAIQVTRDGYTPGSLRVDKASIGPVTIVLSSEATRQSLDPATGGTVDIPLSTAQVIIPPAGLVVEATQQAAVGPITVGLTAIDPSRQANAMPGSYLVRTATGVAPIESFGAIHVSLTDAKGNKLQLAAGKTSTIRIPVASRSAQPPSTIPLLYLEESTGVWKQEGQATLKGKAPNWYYEGEVAHFTFWNADLIMDTVNVSSCLVDSEGKLLPNAYLVAEGIDYSGISHAATDAQGRFTVPMRRNSKAQLNVALDGFYVDAQLGPHAADEMLPTCFKLKPVPNALSILSPPEDQELTGPFARFSVTATGPGPLRYQWQINGQNVPDDWGNILQIMNGQAKEGDKVRVIVSNATSSVTSREALVRVRVPQAPILTSILGMQSVEEGQTLVLTALVSAADGIRGDVTYQWTFKGAAINGATQARLSVPDIAINQAGDYGVILRNAVGTSTSEPWTVAVTAKRPEVAPSPVTPNFPGTDTRSVTRLLTQLLGAASLEALSLVDLVDAMRETGDIRQICRSGTVAATLDGKSTFAAVALTPDADHTLTASFNQCDESDVGALFNGQISSSFRYSENPSSFTLSAETTLTNFSSSSGSAVLSGRFDTSHRMTASGGTGTVTPRPGAISVLPEEAGILTFNGGAVTSRASDSSSGLTFDNLAVNLNKADYVLSGTLTTTFSNSDNLALPTRFSGEVRVTSQGQQVARLFANGAGQLMVDSNGQQTPYMMMP